MSDRRTTEFKRGLMIEPLSMIPPIVKQMPNTVKIYHSLKGQLPVTASNQKDPLNLIMGQI